MDMMDSLRGNNITKVVKLLDLLKKQLDRIESKIDAIESKSKSEDESEEVV